MVGGGARTKFVLGNFGDKITAARHSSEVAPLGNNDIYALKKKRGVGLGVGNEAAVVDAKRNTEQNQISSVKKVVSIDLPEYNVAISMSRSDKFVYS